MWEPSGDHVGCESWVTESFVRLTTHEPSRAMT